MNKVTDDCLDCSSYAMTKFRIQRNVGIVTELGHTILGEETLVYSVHCTHDGCPRDLNDFERENC